MNTNPKKVMSLVEQMTRAEIMARYGPFGNSGGTEWYSIYLDKKDELQEYLFGSSDYIKLGIQWGLLKENKKQKSKKQIISEIEDDAVFNKLSGFNKSAKDMFDVNKMLEKL